MNQIEQIEQRFGFKYPELYKRLYDDGMLDWGEYGPNWHATYWEKLKRNPPLLLFGDDIELLEFNQIVEKIEELKDPEDYRATKPEFQFVPFAMTGGGDLYVFQFDKQCGENVPVTLVPHDNESASIFEYIGQKPARFYFSETIRMCC
ncbi:SMI1/KNR4 family protein [Paenibacillus dendritiformis]|uniref:SMI1/KNR4 family protein n=1 Tax=Paenibacillus dendritiformis TaxID=130049 RepID=UPI0018CD80E1|nr:SMI1/KNR4 family protein [Paenibacillus dendritiformis]